MKITGNIEARIVAKYLPRYKTTFTNTSLRWALNFLHYALQTPNYGHSVNQSNN